MNKRGSYFFVIDAFLAGVIVFITLTVILSSYANYPKTSQTESITEDYISVFLDTEMRDLENSYANKLDSQGLVSNPRRTVFEQIAELYFTNETSYAKGFVKSLTEGIIPEQFGVAYIINDTMVYNRSIRTLDSASFLVSAKKLTFFRLNSTRVIGPVITEVKVWPIE
ncbi:MAG: hypothetical protein V1659_03040 [Candidatus Woesearchaeota archaeon]